MNGTLSIPLTTATVSLALLILVNLAAVIWTSAVLSSRQASEASRTDNHAEQLRSLTDRVTAMGERIASLESRERQREREP